jgi:hypothetical protein
MSSTDTGATTSSAGAAGAATGMPIDGSARDSNAHEMAPEYLETLVPIATPVRLELGEVRSVDLRLR